MHDSFSAGPTGTTNQGQSRARPVLKRRRGACETCRQRKVRCDGELPCGQCYKFQSDCGYATTGRRRRVSLVAGAAAQTPHSDDSRNPRQVAMNSAPTQSHPHSPPPTNGSSASISMSPLSSQNLAEHSSHDSLTVTTQDEQGHLRFSTDNIFAEWEWEDEIHGDSAYTVGDILQPPGLDFSFIESSLETTSCVNQSVPHCQISHRDTAFNTNCTLELKTTTASMAAPHAEILTDRLPIADISATPYLAGLQATNTKLSRPQREQLSQILENLITSRVETSFYKVSEIFCETGHVLQYERRFAQDCVNACYIDPQGIGTFLDRKVLEDVVYDVMDQHTLSTPASVALFNAIFAIGSHHLNLESDLNISAGPIHNATWFFGEALKLRSKIISGDVLLRNFQVLLAMVYFAIQIDSQFVLELISHATYCAQFLRLSSESAINKSYQTSSEKQEAKRALWFLYSIEKPYCLRERTFSVLDEDFIDYALPDLSNSFGDPDWLSINCRYASICSRILKEVYGKRGRDRHSSGLAHPVEKLQHALNLWKNELPFTSDVVDTRAVNYSSLSCLDRRLRVGAVFKYYEALIALQTTQARIHSTVQVASNEKLSKSEDGCVESARDILAISCYISLSDILHNQRLYHLVCVATCLIFVAVSRDPSSHKDLSYLAVASGFFGRLSLDAKVPFDEVAELNRIARVIVKDAK